MSCKLCNLGISGNLLNWCKGYLINRTQRIVIDGYSSSSEITSGVPQGSILGPLFFVIFINDLPDVVCSDNTIALYADNSKMFRVIDCDEDHCAYTEMIPFLRRLKKLGILEYWRITVYPGNLILT